MLIGDCQHLIDQSHLSRQFLVGGTYGPDNGRSLGRGVLFKLQRLFGRSFVDRLIFLLRRSGGEHRRCLSRCTRPLRQAGAVDAERARERRDRGQQTLLEADERQPPVRRIGRRRPGEALRPHLAVPAQYLCQDQLRGIWRQAAQVNGVDHPLRELFAQEPEVRLQAPHHDRIEVGGHHRHATREPLGVQHRQEAGEGVGVTVVRCRRQEQPVLEPTRQLVHGAGELAVHGIPGAARRGGMVRLIQDQKATGPEFPERLAQARHVGLIGQEAVGDQESGPCQPGVGQEASAPSQRHDVLTIDDGERQTELGLQLILPLRDHAGGGRDHDQVDATPEE